MGYVAVHYSDVMMDTIASQITSLPIVYSTVYSDADQRKHQSSASLTFVRGIHRGPVNSPHKWPVTRKMFPFDDVIMSIFKLIIENSSMAARCEAVPGWMPKNFTYEKSALILVMACCRQATTHYLSQCSPWPLSSYGVNRAQWVNVIGQCTVRKSSCLCTHNGNTNNSHYRPSKQWISPIYRKVSNIRRTKSHHLKDSRTVLRLSLPNPLKPDVKSRMKM